ncbi:MAG: histidine phosphatase family protein [Leptospiraceae bacterium]|nr:histidine phosphatase family protein [Leptospiraceae bacterium]
MHLHLIRHGQANALGSDYDQLTEKGHLQARTLGKHLRSTGIAIRHFVRGTLRRHEETLLSLLGGLELNPKECDIRVLPGLDEIDPDTWKSLAIKLAEEDRSVARLLEEMRHAQGQGRRRRLAAITGRVLQTWIMDGSAEFAEFRDRILDTLAGLEVTDTLAVSSGTPIAIAIAASLQDNQPDSVFHWLRHLGNTSYSLLEIKKGRLSPLLLNSQEHLQKDQRTLM